MKKLILASAAVVCAATAFAEGYQVNTLSARQGGMGHTGVAQKLGAESMFFNPAGMGFMDSRLDASASVNFLKPYAKCETGGKWYESDNSVNTPIYANIAGSLSDNLKIGASFYTPYGSNINWGMDWPGAVLNQKVKLTAFTVQPTIAWRILPNLSIGAGLTMSWGDVDLYKALIDPVTFNKVVGMQTQGAVTWPTDVTPASAHLWGKSSLGLGANVGVLYDINSKWSVGAGFRTTSWLEVNPGIAEVIYADRLETQQGAPLKNVISGTLNNIHDSEFDAKMPLPYVLSVGVTYCPTDDWKIAVDAQLTGWSAYESLDVVFHKPQLGGVFDQHIVKEYKNSWAFRAGAEYEVASSVAVRAGVAVDLSPINDLHYNPETPGMTKIEPSIGFTCNISDHFAIDVAAMHVFGSGLDDASCEYEDLLAKSLIAQNPQLAAGLGGYERQFTGNYRVSANNIAVGLRYKF